MNYLEHVGKYFMMLNRVFKKPQKTKVFYRALLKEIEANLNDDLLNKLSENEAATLSDLLDKIR